MDHAVKLALGGVMAVLVLAEVLWAWRTKRHAYEPQEVLCNVVIALFNALLKPATLAWSLLVFQWMEPLRLVVLPHSVAVFLVTFLVTDFAYYWYHRWSHEWPALWAMHHVHHSSPWMNLTTAARLSWIAKVVSPLYFVPLTLIGLPAEFVALSLGLGLLYQFPLHTQAIGTLGTFEGKVLNTPSAHRVHHGSNAEYLDRNYGAVFIVWDVLFGTYKAETTAVRYGVTTGFIGHNPLRVQFEPLLRFLLRRGERAKRPVDVRGRKAERVAH